MHHGANPKGLFLRRVGNQVLANHDEAQGPSGEVGALVAHIWKRHQVANGGKNFRNHPVGGIEVIRANEFPYLGKVETGFRVEFLSGHEPDGERRAAALFSRK